MPKSFGLRQAEAWPPNNINPPRSIFVFESMEFWEPPFHVSRTHVLWNRIDICCLTLAHIYIQGVRLLHSPWSAQDL